MSRRAHSRPAAQARRHSHRKISAAMTSDDTFRIADILRDRGPERYDLHRRLLNPQLPRMLHAIGFDRFYERGEGAYLYDAQGRDYLDMLSGFGVFALGRHHPVIRQAMHEVLDLDLGDLTQFDAPPLAGPLAEQLLERVPHLDRVYFGNSGAEAVETALKFARYATRRPRVVYCRGAFHGLTAGALSVNGAKDFRKGFGPLLPDTAIGFGDLKALRRELARGDVAALLVEPVQGKGVAVSPPGFLAEAQRALHEAGALLVTDEVQCGVGRTGEFFAFQHDGVEPDLVTTAKALSGGYVPVSAVLGREEIFAKVYSSMDRVLVHDSTFGSNAQAMAAGLATLHVMQRDGVIENARTMGALLTDRLQQLAARHETIREIRGRGLMVGIEFGPPDGRGGRAHWRALQLARKGLFAQTVVHALFHRHRVLTQVSGDHIEVIKLIPALIIGEREIDRVVDALDDVLTDAERGTRLTRDFGRMLVSNTVGRGRG